MANQLGPTKFAKITTYSNTSEAAAIENFHTQIGWLEAHCSPVGVKIDKVVGMDGKWQGEVERLTAYSNARVSVSQKTAPDKSTIHTVEWTIFAKK